MYHGNPDPVRLLLMEMSRKSLALCSVYQTGRPKEEINSDFEGSYSTLFPRKGIGNIEDNKAFSLE